MQKKLQIQLEFCSNIVT